MGSKKGSKSRAAVKQGGDSLGVSASPEDPAQVGERQRDNPARREIGLISVSKFDLVLWRKFVGLAKMKGLPIPEAMKEALRLWITGNLKSLDL